MNPLELLAWLRHGRPRAGVATTSSDDGPDAFVRGVERVFGPASALAILDLGSGDGSTPRAEAILRAPWKRLVSVDDFLPGIHRLQRRIVAAADHDILEGRIEEVVREVRAGEFDVAILVDVLPCLRRSDALATLRRLESATLRGVAIHLRLGPFEAPESENALERPRSFWRAEELARLGYDVEVAPGGGAARAFKRTGPCPGAGEDPRAV